MNKQLKTTSQPCYAWRNLLVPVFTAASFILTGCVYDPVYYGPPPHAHYHPYYYDYYYYPSARVYFQFSTGYYFYFTNGHWVRARALPSHIHIDPHDRVQLRIDSDKPYSRQSEHRKQYSPRPDYRPSKEVDQREREANRKWYREYEQTKEKSKKQHKDK